MFRKLRNMFLLLNLISISVMMLTSFVVIYLITYSNIQRDIENELRRISDINRRSPGNERPTSEDETRPEPPEIERFREPQPSFDMSASFVVITAPGGTIVNTSSIFDLDAEFCAEAAEKALNEDKTRGRIRLDGKHWAFIINEAPAGSRITFLDVTSRQAILTQLIYTFIGVAAVMLIFIYVISRIYADRAIAPIREAFTKQKQFVADASHELRTPIAVINANVDVLLTGDESLSVDQLKWLGYIKAESERMTRLTNDLLYLTNMDYAEVTTPERPFDLSSMIENVVLTLDAVFYESGLSIESEITPALFVAGDPDRIRRVAVVLLENALKFSTRGGTVQIDLNRRNQNVILSVTNPGEGIRKEDLEHVFERFYRTDKARPRGAGSYGLGLAIARTIVEQHHGRIGVKSRVGENTTFTVELPATNPPREDSIPEIT